MSLPFAWDSQICLAAALIIFALKAIKTESHLLQMNPISILTYLIQKNALLCSISTISNIGVDIEQIQSIDYTLFKYIAHPDEKRILQSSPNTQHDSLFYHFWTRKEAYCKRTGMGLRQKLSTVNTTTSEPENHFLTWKTDNYICSIYCKCNDKNHIYMITEETIRKFFYRFL